jgi:hypothetical protein
MRRYFSFGFPASKFPGQGDRDCAFQEISALHRRDVLLRDSITSATSRGKLNLSTEV